jgi:hypothetical protein
MKIFEFRESRLAMVKRIIALAAAKTPSKSKPIGMKNRCQLERRESEIGSHRGAPMVQTRRMGMQKDSAQLPNAPRFSPNQFPCSRKS